MSRQASERALNVPRWRRTWARPLVGDPRCAACRLRGGPLCGSCLGSIGAAGARRPPPGLLRITCAWDYSGPARSVLLALKLSARRDCAPPMVEALCGALTARGTAAVLVTWVPTALGSRRRRGFDHAEVLARGVAAELGLPAEPLLWRAVPAADQAGLTASQRRTNLSGAFVARPAEGTVLVVDDLVTTGATLEACAAALRSAGVEEAEGAAVCSARAPGPGGPKV